MTEQSSNLPNREELERVKRLKKEAGDKRIERAVLSASSELLFVFLPFIVIAITIGHRGEFSSFFFLPEWSIVAAVIFGQSIIRLASASVGRRGVFKEAIILAQSVFLVCGLVPTLVILAIVLTAEKVSTMLAWVQGIMFVLSVLIFFLASVAELYVTNSHE